MVGSAVVEAEAVLFDVEFVVEDGLKSALSFGLEKPVAGSKTVALPLMLE